MMNQAEAKLGLYLITPERKQGIVWPSILKDALPEKINIVITSVSTWKLRWPTPMQGCELKSITSSIKCLMSNYNRLKRKIRTKMSVR